MRNYGIEYLSNEGNVLGVPAEWNEPHILYLFERNEKGQGVRLCHPVHGYMSLSALVCHYSELLTAAGIFGVRFLPDGIGVLKREKYFSTYVNGFHGVRAGIFAGAELDAVQVDDAFQRFGTLLKAGRFAKLLDLSDIEAEAFSKSYEAAFSPVTAEEAAQYDFHLWTGSPMLRVFRRSWLPSNENGACIYGACMVGRRDAVDWYKYQRGAVAAAALVRKSDGKVYARAVVWMRGEMITDGSGSTYSGPIADRQYFYNDRSRDVLRYFLSGQGIPFKQDTASNTDGGFVFPDGSVKYGRITAAGLVASPEGCKGFPYLDTLELVSSEGVACNQTDGILGDVFKQRSTQGTREHVGKFVRVTLGVAAGRIFAARVCRALLLPDGSREYTREFSDFQQFGELAPLCEGQGRYDFPGGEYVPGALTALYDVELAYNYAADVKRVISVRCFPHQLRFDTASGRWVVATLWDSERGAWLPVERFRLRSSGYIEAV